MNHSTHAADVVGYTMDAEIYCPDCILEKVKARYPLDYPIESTTESWRTTEDQLQFVARQPGVNVNYADERTYDSADFPKVILGGAAHDGCSEDNGYAPGQCNDRCTVCHEPIGAECPNAAEVER